MTTQMNRERGAASEVSGDRFQTRDVPSAAIGSIVSWQGVVAAGAVAIGLLFLATSLWNALAFTSNYAWFADNLAWLNAATAVITLLVAGLLAGWLCRRGVVAGAMNGLTVWGVLITGSVVFGVGSAFPLTTLSQAGRDVTSAQPGSLWPTFAAYGIGLLAAVVGGVLGALIPPTSDDEVIIDLRVPTVSTVGTGQHAGDLAPDPATTTTATE